MAKTRNKSAQSKILPQPAAAVKARIVGANIKFKALAKAARISQPSLSNYLNGGRSDRAVQIRIWDAFCQLSGQSIAPGEFWGELLSERMAS